MRGFPDGHLTQFEQAARIPNQVLGYSCFAAGTYLVVSRRSATRGKMLAALALFGVVIAVRCLGLEWYFVEHLGMDNGRGG